MEIAEGRPMRTRARWAVTALVLACAGCATGADRGTVVSAFAPSAGITVVKGHQSGWGYSGSQIYTLSQNGKCTDSKQIARLLWTTSKDRSVRVAGGGRVVVMATTTYFSSYGSPSPGIGATGGLAMKSCGGAVSFEAKAGHDYQVTQKAPYYGRACTMEVTDKAGGRAPDGLKIADDASCGAFNP